MENASLPNDVYNNVTISAPVDGGGDDMTLYLANIRDLALKVMASHWRSWRALKVVYIIIGTVGVLDNLFVVLVFFFFINITEKVLISLML